MGLTLIEKILSSHCDKVLRAGDIGDISIDARIARDFGGANVVKNIEDHDLTIDDPTKTFFTFDCNPGGSDQKYASNQQQCRIFARTQGIKVFDINHGIGTHVAIEDGLINPGGTLVSTDSHANILGAIGSFGQGMGDKDIAAAWAQGKIWFKVPKSIKVILKGNFPANVHAKDIVLYLIKEFGASGLLGYAAEFHGNISDALKLSDRITIASMATEMGGIIALFPPNNDVISYFKNRMPEDLSLLCPDEDANYEQIKEFDISNLTPLLSKPGHPEDVIPVKDMQGIKIDSAFIGSCTNGRFEDLEIAAKILADRKVAPGVVLKIVPSTQKVWKQCLKYGLIHTFMDAGALIGNPGCAGCAAGQIGQNGPGEVTISTGNRNFTGKQGKGDVYLASPATVAASAVAGIITSQEAIPAKPVLFQVTKEDSMIRPEKSESTRNLKNRPVEINGRIWMIHKDNIDTDMIFHNRYLAITKTSEMGQYTFDNLDGWEDFAKKSKPGDIIITGENFGAGSSRQQAVDCFLSLGIQAIIAKSFGAIYERNAINAGFPVIISNIIDKQLKNSEEVSINLETGEIVTLKSRKIFQAEPFTDIQMNIYQREGLL